MKYFKEDSPGYKLYSGILNVELIERDKEEEGKPTIVVQLAGFAGSYYIVGQKLCDLFIEKFENSLLDVIDFMADDEVKKIIINEPENYVERFDIDGDSMW